jgi:hypothetical protein
LFLEVFQLFFVENIFYLKHKFVNETGHDSGKGGIGRGVLSLEPPPVKIFSLNPPAPFKMGKLNYFL